MTVKQLAHDDAIAIAVRCRDRYAQDAAYWRRAGLGVEEIRRAIAYEELAREGDDLVTYLRMHRPPAVDEAAS